MSLTLHSKSSSLLRPAKKKTKKKSTEHTEHTEHTENTENTENTSSVLSVRSRNTKVLNDGRILYGSSADGKCYLYLYSFTCILLLVFFYLLKCIHAHSLFVFLSFSSLLCYIGDMDSDSKLYLGSGHFTVDRYDHFY